MSCLPGLGSYQRSLGFICFHSIHFNDHSTLHVVFNNDRKLLLLKDSSVQRNTESIELAVDQFPVVREHPTIGTPGMTVDDAFKDWTT